MTNEAHATIAHGPPTSSLLPTHAGALVQADLRIVFLSNLPVNRLYYLYLLFVSFFSLFVSIFVVFVLFCCFVWFALFLDSICCCLFVFFSSVFFPFPFFVCFVFSVYLFVCLSVPPLFIKN